MAVEVLGDDYPTLLTMHAALVHWLGVLFPYSVGTLVLLGVGWLAEMEYNDRHRLPRPRQTHRWFHYPYSECVRCGGKGWRVNPRNWRWNVDTLTSPCERCFARGWTPDKGSQAWRDAQHSPKLSLES